MKAINILAAGLALCAAPAAAAAPRGQGNVDALPGERAQALTRAFLVGAWSDDGDCDHVVELLGDGRYFAGARGGIWQLDGAELTLTGEEVRIVRIVPIDEDTIGVIAADGSLGESVRCVPETLLPGPDETV